MPDDRLNLSDLKAHTAKDLLAMAEDLEIENARAAWDWAASQGQVSWLNEALDGLAGYYDWRVRYEEGETALQAAADRLQAAAADDGLRLLALEHGAGDGRFLERPGQGRGS
mgnify:CR=1 FL=1